MSVFKVRLFVVAGKIYSVFELKRVLLSLTKTYQNGEKERQKESKRGKRERDNIEKDDTIGRKKREREKDYGKRKIEGENRERNNIEKERRKIHFCTLIFPITLKQSSLRNQYIYFLYRIGSWVVFQTLEKVGKACQGQTLAFYKHSYITAVIKSFITMGYVG